MPSISHAQDLTRSPCRMPGQPSRPNTCHRPVKRIPIDAAGREAGDNTVPVVRYGMHGIPLEFIQYFSTYGTGTRKIHVWPKLMTAAPCHRPRRLAATLPGLSEVPLQQRGPSALQQAGALYSAALLSEPSRPPRSCLVGSRLVSCFPLRAAHYLGPCIRPPHITTSGT